MFGHLGLDGIPDDHAALELMHHILTGGAFVSRMMEQLRTRTGITAAQYGMAEPGRGVRNPYVWRFSGNPETLARGIRLALEEIRRYATRGSRRRSSRRRERRTSRASSRRPTTRRTAPPSAWPRNNSSACTVHRSTGYLNYYAGDSRAGRGAAPPHAGRCERGRTEIPGSGQPRHRGGRAAGRHPGGRSAGGGRAGPVAAARRRPDRAAARAPELRAGRPRSHGVGRHGVGHRLR
jgi:hypothetical protein